MFRKKTIEFLANVIRLVLIVAICIVGASIIHGLSRTSTASPERSKLTPNLPVPYAPTTGQWKFEITDDAVQLLPLPVDAKTQCRRLGEDKAVHMEVVSLSSSSDHLLELWRNNNWDVRPAPNKRPGNFAFICTRGDELIYAWSANPLTKIQTLMLVASPHLNAGTLLDKQGKINE